jgi:hypothetical protein
MTVAARSVVQALRRGVLSTWTIAAACSLGIAWFVDESFGYLAADSAGRAESSSGAISQIGRLGAPPVAVSIALMSALWLAVRKRPKAAAAVSSMAAVVIAFGARALFTADSIGWSRALDAALIDSRTVATTSIALVLGAVLYREGLIGRGGAGVVGFGVPLLLGLSRIALRVHSLPEIAEQWVIGLSASIGILLAYVLADRESM